MSLSKTIWCEDVSGCVSGSRRCGAPLIYSYLLLIIIRVAGVVFGPELRVAGVVRYEFMEWLYTKNRLTIFVY